eukprot:159123-Heterocapsa_arctica.AAC.1
MTSLRFSFSNLCCSKRALLLSSSCAWTNCSSSLLRMSACSSVAAVISGLSSCTQASPRGPPGASGDRCAASASSHGPPRISWLPD